MEIIIKLNDPTATQMIKINEIVVEECTKKNEAVDKLTQLAEKYLCQDKEDTSI